MRLCNHSIGLVWSSELASLKNKCMKILAHALEPPRLSLIPTPWRPSSFQIGATRQSVKMMQLKELRLCLWSTFVMQYIQLLKYFRHKLQEVNFFRDNSFLSISIMCPINHVFFWARILCISQTTHVHSGSNFHPAFSNLIFSAPSPRANWPRRNCGRRINFWHLYFFFALTKPS